MRCRGDTANHAQVSDKQKLPILPSLPPHLHDFSSVWATAMVTLITEQLHKQSLEDPYQKAFSFNVNVVSGCSTNLCFERPLAVKKIFF